ncbi:unnamed protein product [Urochloa humidicola]
MGGGGVCYQQTDRVELYTAIVTEVIRRYNDPPSEADGTAAAYSNYIYVFDDDGRRISRHRRSMFPATVENEYEEEHPFPVQEEAPPGAATEAAIAALEAVAAPADDCCPVCLQEEDGPGGAAAWRRVAPCGHRFHAACVAQWLRVKLSCPVCRCPADAACRRDDALPAFVEEMLAASGDDEPRGGLRRVRQRNSARWAQIMATYDAYSTGIDR